MKTVCKKLLCLMLVAMLLVSAVPAAFAAEGGFGVMFYVYDAEGDKVDEGYKYFDNTVTLKMSEINQYFKVHSDKAVGQWYVGNNLSGDQINSASYEVSAATHIACRLTTAIEETPDETPETPDETPVCQHANLNEVVTKVATCTEDGLKTITCADCDDYSTTETISNLGGHTLAGDKCMNSFSDGSKCTYVKETAPVAGNLIVYVMTKTEDTDYVDFNAGKAITLEGKADATRNKALAESIVGKQLIDYKWQGASEDANGNVTVNLLATIMETKDGKNVYKLRVYANNGTSDYKQIDIYEGEGILAAIKNAGLKPSYEDHVLVGYLNNHTGTSKSYLTIYDVADGDDADSSGVIKVYADWREKTDDDDEDYEYGEGGGLYGDDNDDPIYDVVLYIYTNGKTSSYAKKVTSSTMGKHTKDGVLSRDEVELVVENYFKTTEDTKYYGLFNKYYWNSGNYLTENAKYSIELDPDETNYVYVMVKNATAYVADSSNPKTGDTIMIAVSTMALAAAALVSVVELKKRKMI